MMSTYVILFLAFILYRLSKAIYNLYLHPLRRFPGPKVAAASHLYEFYWSVIRDGEFTWEIERMHKKYGKCVMYDAVLYLNAKQTEVLSFASLPMSFISATRHSIMRYTPVIQNELTVITASPDPPA